MITLTEKKLKELMDASHRIEFMNDDGRVYKEWRDAEIKKLVKKMSFFAHEIDWSWNLGCSAGMFFAILFDFGWIAFGFYVLVTMLLNLLFFCIKKLKEGKSSPNETKVEKHG